MHYIYFVTGKSFVTQDNSFKIVRQNEVSGLLGYQVYTEMTKFATIKS